MFDRELAGFTGRACLVHHGAQYFVVSSAVVPESGPETLVFPANAAGQVTRWREVAGGYLLSREEAIHDLAVRLHKLDIAAGNVPPGTPPPGSPPLLPKTTVEDILRKQSPGDRDHRDYPLHPDR